LNRLRGKLTYANVTATLALFLVLAGGTAFAASQMLPKNSVGAKQIRKGAVTPAKLAPATAVRLTGPKGATGPQGPQGQPGVQGPAGAVRGFQAADHSDAEVGTSPFGTTPVSLAVPVGTYFVTANLEFLSTGKDTVFCRLINGIGGAESEAVLREQSVASGTAENLTISVFSRSGPASRCRSSVAAANRRPWSGRTGATSSPSRSRKGAVRSNRGSARWSSSRRALSSFSWGRGTRQGR
jgi:hypothetical protein